MPARSDTTNVLRQRRHRLRRKALTEALAAPAATDGDANADRRAPLRGAIDHLKRLDRRHANETARHAFATAIEGSAEAVAQKLVELALGGDVAALTLVARSVLPAARPDDRRVKVDLPPLTTLENVAEARRRVADAVARGEVGLGDGRDLMGLLEGVKASLVETEKREVLAQLRGALTDAQAGGVRARISVLAREAEILVEASRRVQDDGTLGGGPETFAGGRSA